MQKKIFLSPEKKENLFGMILSDLRVYFIFNY